MDAMSSPSVLTANNLLAFLQSAAPEVNFCTGQSFFWSPDKLTVTYNPDNLDSDRGKWALLHEVGHALLEHKSYDLDAELLLMEVAAWHKATELAEQTGLQIDDQHMQDCLDTYRDWVHQRSTCPTCGVVSFQESAKVYSCYNCHNSWHVSSSRFCRPYRLSARHAQKKKSPAASLQTTFRSAV